MECVKQFGNIFMIDDRSVPNKLYVIILSFHCFAEMVTMRVSLSLQLQFMCLFFDVLKEARAL
jgi:hypothetical protein